MVSIAARDQFAVHGLDLKGFNDPLTGRPHVPTPPPPPEEPEKVKAADPGHHGKKDHHK